MSSSTLRVPDFSLIHDYVREDERAGQSPAVNHFHKDAKDLYYINASHVAGIDNPTCQTIKQAIEKYQPQLVVVEGLGADKGISPSGYAAHVQHSAKESFTHAGEPEYAAWLAQGKNIPFTGAEPSDTTMFAQMKNEGYSAKDVMAFYLLRNVEGYSRQGQLGQHKKDGDIKAWANDYLQTYPGFSHIPDKEKLTFDEFKTWYDAHKAPGSGGYMDVRNSDIAPYSNPDANYFQKLSAATAKVREKNIDATIANALNSHDKILVVYGGAHLTMARPVFENMFGDKGETLNLVPDNRQDGSQASSQSAFTKTLKGGAVALLALATVVAAISLSLLSLAASSIGKALKNDEKPHSPASAKPAPLNISVTFDVPAQGTERRDGKNWVDATQAKSTKTIGIQ